MEDFGQCYCQSKTVECLFFFCNFESPMKSFSINFNCWSFVFTRKYSGEKFWFSFVLFKSKYGGVPPKFRIYIFVYLKRIGLYCNIFLESWCISFLRTNFRYKFEIWKIMKNHENRRFSYFWFKTNTVESPWFFSVSSSWFFQFKI